MQRNRAIIVAAGVLASGALTGGLAGPGAFGATGSQSSTVSSGPPVAPAAAVAGHGTTATTSDQTAAFGALRRPQNAQDRQASSQGAVLRALWSPQQLHGANPGLGRQALATDGSSVLIVPANGGVCMVGVAPTTAMVTECDATSDAAQNGLGSVAHTPQGTVLQGILPAGSHDVQVIGADGSRSPVTLSSDDAYTISPSGKPTGLAFTDAAGTAHELHFPSAPPPLG
jgi:hypothetical protein